jgi:hypothetical protein
MRTFSYQTTGATTADHIAHRNAMVAKQNAMVQSGGTTVPQFREAGAPTGNGPNHAIQQMAGRQLQMDENSKYNGCVGKAAGACGGSRRRRRTRKTRKSRKSRR